jgi:hypothetical protein
MKRKKIKSIHERIEDKIYVQSIQKITATKALRMAKEYGYDGDRKIYNDGKKYFWGYA